MKYFWALSFSMNILHPATKKQQKGEPCGGFIFWCKIEQNRDKSVPKSEHSTFCKIGPSFYEAEGQTGKNPTYFFI